MSLTENSDQVFLPGGCNRTQNLRFGPYTNNKRDDFDFKIVNFPFLDGDVPRVTSYGVYISQLIRFARTSSHVTDFNTRNKLLTFLNNTMGIINFAKPFLNFIDDTLIVVDFLFIVTPI